MMIFRPLSIEDMEQVRHWRNDVPETTRTPFALTREQQEDYYHTVICDRCGTTRYWGFWRNDVELIGYGGLEHIEWENRLAEISILISPEYRGKGYGQDGIAEILRRGFCEMNLENIYAECYTCSAAIGFWTLIAEKYKAYTTVLPARKYYAGRYYESVYYNFAKKVIYPDA